MRVCVDISSAVHQTAGIGRYAAQLTEHLPKVDAATDYAFFCNDPGRVAKSPTGSGSPLYTVRIGNKAWRLWLHIAYRTRRGMDRRFPEVDLFHGTDLICPPFRRIPAVVTVHDLSFLLLPRFHTLANRLNLRLILPWVLRQVRLVIADSQNTKRDLERVLGVPEDRVRVVPLGVESRFAPIDRQSAAARIADRQGVSGPFVLHTGTVEPRKNLAGLIAAFGALKALGFPHKLVIAGRKGWLSESLFRLVKEKGLWEEVIFSGFVADGDLPALYSAADVLAFPSHYEGFGLPPLEAMACGTPVVCSDTSSLPEVVGDAGLLVSPDDIGGLTEALRRVLEDEALRREVVAKGLVRARGFTWEKTARMTAAVYRECYTGTRADGGQTRA